MRFPCAELEVSCWSEEKLNHVLKNDSDKLFKDLLYNKIFSGQIFILQFCLNRGLVWKSLHWKLIIPTAFFGKMKIC